MLPFVRTCYDSDVLFVKGTKSLSSSKVTRELERDAVTHTGKYIYIFMNNFPHEGLEKLLDQSYPNRHQLTRQHTHPD